MAKREVGVGVVLLVSAAAAMAQATPDAKAGSVIVETQQPKPKVRVEAPKGPDPAIIFVGGSGRSATPVANRPTTVEPKVPAKPVSAP